MRGWVRLGASALLAALVSQGAFAATPQVVTVTVAAIASIYAPYFVALDKGYYRQEGLDVKIIDAAGGAATPALLSGTVDISTSSASALTAILRGAPLRIIYTAADRPPYQLWSSRPDLKTLKDLKGLQIGIASRGDSYEIAMRLALEGAGLPQDWVGYTPTGFNPAVRDAAMRTGSLPAALLDPIDAQTMEAKGELKNGHLILDLAQTLRLPYTGAAVSARLLATDPKMIEGFLRATAKGLRYTRAFEPQTEAILKLHEPSSDMASIAAEYRVTVPTLTEQGIASDDLIRKDIAVRAAVLGLKPGDVPPIEKIYDYKLIREATAELDRSGWKPRP